MNLRLKLFVELFFFHDRFFSAEGIFTRRVFKKFKGLTQNYVTFTALYNQANYHTVWFLGCFKPSFLFFQSPILLARRSVLFYFGASCKIGGGPDWTQKGIRYRFFWARERGKEGRRSVLVLGFPFITTLSIFFRSTPSILFSFATLKLR